MLLGTCVSCYSHESKVTHHGSGDVAMSDNFAFIAYPGIALGALGVLVGVALVVYSVSADDKR